MNPRFLLKVNIIVGIQIKSLIEKETIEIIVTDKPNSWHNP